MFTTPMRIFFAAARMASRTVSSSLASMTKDTASFRWEVYDDSFNVLARGTVAGDKGMVTAQRAAEAAARGLFH